MGDPNIVIRVCRGRPGQPHATITFSDKRDDPQPCPLCGAVYIGKPVEDR